MFTKPRLMANETSFKDEMNKYWGDWGLSSQVKPLKSVLMRRPGAEIDNFDWEKSRFRAAIDPDRFRKQHDDLANLYRSLGIDVYYVDEQRIDRPNAVFMRDLLFMTPEGAIICRPALDVRRGEEVAVAKTLSNLNIPILRTITGNATFEGADCFWANEKTVIIAQSSRTNKDAFNQLEFEFKRMGVENIITVHIPLSNAHLDGAMNFLSEDTIIVNPNQIGYQACKTLSDMGFKILEAPSHEETQKNLALNMVVIKPGVVIQADGNPITKKYLQDNGIEVISIEFDEILKGWGSVHCCTATLKRG